jgi:hypothetical protein
MPDLEKQFPYVPGPMVIANPRFPHALARQRSSAAGEGSLWSSRLNAEN